MNVLFSHPRDNRVCYYVIIVNTEENAHFKKLDEERSSNHPSYTEDLLSSHGAHTYMPNEMMCFNVLRSVQGTCHCPHVLHESSKSQRLDNLPVAPCRAAVGAQACLVLEVPPRGSPLINRCSI